MGEVAAEVVEEVMKQDSCAEHLAEPLLIILSPPPPFLPVPGEPSMFWSRWIKAFEHYLEALGENDLVDSSKLLLLRNCLGQEGQRIFTALIQGESTYAAAASALTLYFSSDHISQTYLLKFHQRVQMPGETVEQFVSALEALLRPCNLGDSQDKLIVNQLIMRSNCPQLKERLLSEKETPTVATALFIGKEVESASSQAESFDIHEVSVDIGDDLELPVLRARRGRPRRGEKRPKTKASLTKNSRRLTRYKEDYYYSNDKLYYSGDEEYYSKTGDDGNLTADDASDEELDDDNGSSSQVKEEEVLYVASDNSDDKDFVIGQTKLKGPFCPICTNKRFRDANKLARHMRTHTKEKPFSCPLCPMTFSQSYHMTRHLRNQHGAGQHVCSACGKSLETFSELQIHKKTHPSQVLSCPNCQEKFQNNREFLSHIVSHSKYQDKSTQHCNEVKKEEKIESSNEDNQEMDDCNDGNDDAEDSDDADENERDDADSGNNNRQDEGPEVKVETEDKDSDEKSQDGGSKKDNDASETKAKGHFCPICVNRCFRGANKLARHMRMHTKEKPFGCPVCALTFSQSYHMTRHLRKQHGLGQYICAKCGKSLGSWLELKAHKKTHTSEGLSCPVCDKIFKEKAGLVSHLKSHKKAKSGPRCLICSECGKVFSRLYHLKRHIVAHRKATNGECYNCPECQKTYAFPEDLKKHLEIHVKENNGTCPKCNQTFNSPEELEVHMVVHEKSYTCSTCGKKFKVEYALKKHEQGHQEEQYYCSLCRKRFIKLSHYKRHILVHDRRESKCPHCDSVFLKLTALKYHLRTHTEERPYQCSCCVETFEEKEDLEQHCLKHRKFKKERPYSCTRCDSAFSVLLELTEHMSLHVGEQPLGCPICGKTFLNKNKLEKHLSIHNGERPHLCSLCGNGFPSAASLKLHSHIHTGEKPFKCSQCSKSFRSSSGLRLHSRQHMAVRPSFECPECGRTYGRMTELKMHQRYHTGDKPYSCTCCNKRFISKDKLNVHMRIHTGERPYSCTHCGQTFTQTGDRNRHINKYHN